jgi:sterol desaturase/sphingolipid hydroxylase (fatty acid hydroxylase superfamily)
MFKFIKKIKIMDELKEIKGRLRKIELRNKKVESDKAWEISIARRLLLIGFTYLTIGFYLQAIKIPRPWLNSIVPAIAFMLSTLTLPFFRDVWLNYMNRE